MKLYKPLHSNSKTEDSEAAPHPVPKQCTYMGKKATCEYDVCQEPLRLAVMVFSGLFQDRFIDQVQVVGYLHDQMAVEDRSSGGWIEILRCG